MYYVVPNGKRGRIILSTEPKISFVVTAQVPQL